MTACSKKIRAVSMACVNSHLDIFPELKFGTDIDGTAYFDATEYLKIKFPGSKLDVYDFLNKFDFQIQCIAEAYSLPSDSIMLINQDGHQLLIGHLCYPFIFYTDHQFGAYINEVIEEVFVNKYFISDELLVDLVSKRFNPDLIQQIFINHDDGKKTS